MARKGTARNKWGSFFEGMAQGTSTGYNLGMKGYANRRADAQDKRAAEAADRAAELHDHNMKVGGINLSNMETKAAHEQTTWDRANASREGGYETLARASNYDLSLKDWEGKEFEPGSEGAAYQKNVMDLYGGKLQQAALQNNLDIKRLQGAGASLEVVQARYAANAVIMNKLFEKSADASQEAAATINERGYTPDLGTATEKALEAMSSMTMQRGVVVDSVVDEDGVTLALYSTQDKDANGRPVVVGQKDYTFEQLASGAIYDDIKREVLNHETSTETSARNLATAQAGEKYANEQNYKKQQTAKLSAEVYKLGKEALQNGDKELATIYKNADATLSKIMESYTKTMGTGTPTEFVAMVKNAQLKNPSFQSNIIQIVGESRGRVSVREALKAQLVSQQVDRFKDESGNRNTGKHAPVFYDNTTGELMVMITADDQKSQRPVSVKSVALKLGMPSDEELDAMVDSQRRGQYSAGGY